jgi:hypothetical protein
MPCSKAKVIEGGKNDLVTGPKERKYSQDDNFTYSKDDIALTGASQKRCFA